MSRFYRGLGWTIIWVIIGLIPAKGLALPDETATTIRYYQKAFRYQYHRALLKLVLSATEDKYGPYRMQPFPATGKEVSEARGLDLLEDGIIDVVFLSTSREREAKFRPVRIPLLRGILGYRLLMIRRERQAVFAKVRTLDELRAEFIAGFNPQWADYPIYAANRIALVDTAAYSNLFGMLVGSRFDYIPRGVNEIWEELAHFRTRFPDLAVESHLALYYPFPVYFFVRRDNEALAKRLETGLNRIKQNGRFAQLFWQYHGEAIARAKAGSRLIFLLDNPTLPEDTPAIDMSWWLPATAPPGSGVRAPDTTLPVSNTSPVRPSDNPHPH
ncbi:hypothetical protein QQM79_15305 [Marinobacteraceae bacterium S3BR75-40.1]